MISVNEIKNLSRRKSLYPSAQEMMPPAFLMKLLEYFILKNGKENQDMRSFTSFICILAKTKRTIHCLRIKFLSSDIVYSHDGKINFFIPTAKMKQSKKEKVKKNTVSLSLTTVI